MQFIFVTILLLFLFLPGIAFRLGYLKRDGLRIIADIKFYIEILIIIFLSIFFHSIVWIITETCNINFHIDILYQLMVGNNQLKLEDSEGFIVNFIVYNFLFSFLLFLIGLWMKTILDKNQVEFSSDFDFLDYTGTWDRILNYKVDKGQFLPVIDALVEINEESYIYSGVLSEYFIDSSGNIDKFILTEVIRTRIKDLKEQYFEEEEQLSGDLDWEKETYDLKDDTDIIDDAEIKEILSSSAISYIDRSFEINSHHFVLYGSSIKNVGIRYKSLREKKE